MNKPFNKRVGYHFALAALILASTIAQPAMAVSEGAKKTTTTLSKNDLSTASGFFYTGLKDGLVRGLILSPSWYAQLQPDKWTSNDEGQSWRNWYTAFGKTLFESWRNSSPIAGQQTIKIAVLPDKTYKLTYEGPALGGADKRGSVDSSTPDQKFHQEVERVLSEAMKNAPELPQTKNPLREFRFAITFGADADQFPKHQGSAFKVLSRINGSGDNVIIYFTSPSAGVQSVSEGDGANVVGLDPKQFQELTPGGLRKEAEALAE